MRTPSRRNPTLFVALPLLLSALAGCESDPLPDDATAPPAPAAEQPPAVPDDAAPAFLRLDRQDLPPADGDAGGGTSTLIRQMLSSAPGAVFNPNENFYLAVHRRELGKRWFLSAYLKQFFPGGIEAGTASSLGTRVITFKVQNGKLYLFDVDDRKQTSDTFGQEVLVDAYPLVDVSKLVPAASGLAGKALKDYVVVDPSAGLNRFGVVADAFGQGGLDDYGEKLFQVELKFCQRFRNAEDGITFEQAFTGYSETPRAKDLNLHPYFEWVARVEPNLFRASGILGLSLRRYQEGEGFQEVPGSNHFFASDARQVKNEGYVENPATKWNIHPGDKPIEWLISPLVQKIQQRADVQAAGVDLYGTIKRGIESWNEAFGFEALRASLADPDDSFAQDDKNYLVYDVNPSIGFAFANWRVNPNSGEIRGASVYLNDVFLESALIVFDDSRRPTAPAPTGPVEKVRRPALTWQPFPSRPLCDLTPQAMTQALQDAAAAAEPTLTVKEKVEAFLSHVVAHEIGHTLGLRHNFKGSLVGSTSSIMDYLLDAPSVLNPGPAAYDIGAIKYLYGMAPSLPPHPFCTDHDVGRDPTCERFDQGADPLREYWIPGYTVNLRRFLSEGNFLYGNRAFQAVRPLVGFVRRARTLQDRVTAYQALIADISANADQAGPPPPPSYVIGANIFSEIIMDMTFPDMKLYEDWHPVYRPDSSPLHPQVESLFVNELRGNLLDLDGLRVFEARRLTVDVLKRMQTLPALQVLREADQVLAVPPATPVSSDQQALIEDLRARINAAKNPYFVI